MTMADFGYGHEIPNDSGSDFNAIAFVVSQMTAKMDTAKLVQVQAVHGGGLAGAGTVDVLPLVQQIDGNGYGTPHGTVYGLPWSRIQGGKNAIICDPQVGDTGYVVAADRDISVLKNQSPGAVTTKGYLPGSRRRFSIADGIYAGGCLNVAPNQYLIFTATGVRLVDMNGNSFAMGPTGVTWTDFNGNQMVTGVGFVNFITAALQVNGIPVVVP
jgi:hypothetical protein